jgi:hypothetical protein
VAISGFTLTVVVYLIHRKYIARIEATPNTEHTTDTMIVLVCDNPVVVVYVSVCNCGCGGGTTVSFVVLVVVFVVFVVFVVVLVVLVVSVLLVVLVVFVVVFVLLGGGGGKFSCTYLYTYGHC